MGLRAEASEKEASPPSWDIISACCWPLLQVPICPTALACSLCDSPGSGVGTPSRTPPCSQSRLLTSLDSQRASHCLLICCSGSRFLVPYASNSHLTWSTESKSLTLKWLHGPEEKSKWEKGPVESVTLKSTWTMVQWFHGPMTSEM